MTPRTVYLVDDDAAVRRSLGELLTVCGFSVRTFGAGREFLEAAERLADGCILLDLRMKDMSGLEVQAELFARGVRLPIVFLTAHGDVPTGVTAMKQGALDFLQKPVREETLLEALEHAFGRLETGRDQRVTNRKARDMMANLTPREREVIGLVVSGMRNRQIATRLNIALPTVKVHRMRAMAKMGVETVQELVRAWQAGTSAD